MKIVAGMGVFEEEDFIESALSSLYEWCDTILVCEGAWKTTVQKIGSSTSRDRTTEIINDFSDPDKKIKLFHFSGKDATEHRDFCLHQALKYKPDWYVVADGDEIYHEKDFPTLKDVLSSTKSESLSMKCRLYWNDLYHYEYWGAPARFFKVKDRNPQALGSCRIKHRNGSQFREEKCKTVTVFHPSYVRNLERQKTKIAHRTLDNNKQFPHTIDEDGNTWRGCNLGSFGGTQQKWFENLKIGTREELPVFLQNHKLIDKRWVLDQQNSVLQKK